MFGSSRSSTSFGIASAGMEGLSLSSSASTSASASSASTATTNRSAVDTKEQARKRNILGVIEEHPEWDVTSEDVENDIERASEIVKSLQQQSIKKVMRLLKAAQNLSVAFVVDTTGSMDAHITGVKDQIRAMVKEISKQRVKMNFAFVGYKDHCDGADHFEVLPFTKDIAVFQRFLDGITDTGGGDQAEEVLGGLMQALTKLQWNKYATNMIFHIADAPHHGSQYQNVSGAYDDYPSGHHLDPSPSTLFGKMNDLDIQYFFGKINSSTDGMVAEFSRHLLTPVTSFDVRDPVNISDSVVHASSISLTAKREKSMSLLRSGASSASRSRMKAFIYTKTEPTWESVLLVQGTLVSYKIPETAQQIINGNFTRVMRLARFKIASNPFAHGAKRAAFYALEHHKEKDGHDDTTDNMTTASYLAIQFNRLIKDATGDATHQLKFLKAKILRIGRNAPFQYFSVEKRYRDYAASSFVKLSNNAGHVAASDQLYVAYAMAFSHWTWHCTGGYLIVVDLQGQRVKGDKLLLTDPAIHCCDSIRFNSGTNLGDKGIREFFRTHECNKFCRSLGLKSRDEQLAEWEMKARALAVADVPGRTKSSSKHSKPAKTRKKSAPIAKKRTSESH